MFSSTTFTLQLLLASTALAQTPGVNCFLQVPPNPLSATGLATPFQLSNCDQTQFATQANFVEAAILDPTTGAIQIYSPLVINANATKPNVDFIPPVVPTLPAGAVVALFFGSNAVTLTLTGDTAGGNCVNGDGQSIFGQFAYCNSPAFFTAAYAAVSSGLTVVPPPGTTTKTTTPQPCPVTRDFRMVDMDQSDNVDSTYLLINGHILAQNTPANAKTYSNATEINNGSDNLLLNAFLEPTLGCTPYTAPSITSASGFSSAMALNEIQSQFFPPIGGPALIPLNDDFTVIDGSNGNVTQSLIKTNLYRAGVGQPQAADVANASATTYCTRYAASGIFIAENQALLSTGTSPAPGASSNLYTFLANRFAASFGPVPALGCQTIFGLAVSPVNQTVNGDCIVVAATINTTVLNDIINGAILPLGSTTTATSSVSTVSSTTATTSSTLATTALFLNTTFVAQATTQATTTTQATLATTSTTTSALTATTSVTTTTVLVEVVTFFVFVLSLGGAAPGVTGSIEEFIVLEEIFVDLPSAASAACTHQFNACASLAGSAFSGTDCLNQLNSCQGVATTASPTATTPGTVTATATVPTTSTIAPAATTAAAAGNVGGAKEVSGAGAGAGAPAGAGDNTCPAAVTVTSWAAQSTVTVTATPSGVASPTGGISHRHSHGKVKIRENNVREAQPPVFTNYWKA